jgi:hypothetical protein
MQQRGAESLCLSPVVRVFVWLWLLERSVHVERRDSPGLQIKSAMQCAGKIEIGPTCAAFGLPFLRRTRGGLYVEATAK